jgi:hypothetical protein
MSAPDVFVGIDVSKVPLDVALRPTGDRWPVSHDEPGMTILVERLRTIQPALIGLEATGGLEVPVAGAVAAAGLPVVVVNPATPGISPKPRAGWPRPTPWMPRAWPTVRRRYGPPLDRCPMLRRKR